MSILQGIAICLRLIFLVAPAAFLNVCRAIIRAKAKGLSVRVGVKNAISRSLITNILPRQLQFILPAGTEVYQQWLKSSGRTLEGNHELSHNVDVLADGHTKLFWVGTKSPKSNVILFLHGGGYVLPLSKGHLNWAEHFRQTAAQEGVQLGVAILDYSLCPENVYPKQMHQAVLALDHLFSLGYSATQIVVGGDSAGGHLSLCVLSHIMHPYYRTGFPRLRLKETLAGCFLVSPLLSLQLDTPSYSENQNADLLSIPVIRDWGRNLLDSTPFVMEKRKNQGWGMALVANDEWWDDLGASVKRVYVVGGGEELFRDDIIKFGKVLENIKGMDLQLHINTHEAHDATYMEFEGEENPSKSTLRLTRWILDSFRSSTESEPRYMM